MVRAGKLTSPVLECATLRMHSCGHSSSDELRQGAAVTPPGRASTVHPNIALLIVVSGLVMIIPFVVAEVRQSPRVQYLYICNLKASKS